MKPITINIKTLIGNITLSKPLTEADKKAMLIEIRTTLTEALMEAVQPLDCEVKIEDKPAQQ